MGRFIPKQPPVIFTSPFDDDTTVFNSNGYPSYLISDYIIYSSITYEEVLGQGPPYDTFYRPTSWIETSQINGSRQTVTVTYAGFEITDVVIT